MGPPIAKPTKEPIIADPMLRVPSFTTVINSFFSIISPIIISKPIIRFCQGAFYLPQYPNFSSDFNYGNGAFKNS
jgi:hypothetical protein